MGVLFGTNGVRGTINEGLTADIVLRLSAAVGSTLGPGLVSVSGDARMGREMFQRAAVAGLLSTGCSVVDIGPAPTPVLQYITPRLGCVAGIMVTASHNPAQYNGIKVLGHDGIEVDRNIETEIEAVFTSRRFRIATWRDIGEVIQERSAIRRYIEAIKGLVDTEAIRRRRLKVVVDGANSVGALVTPTLLRELGCKVVSINSQLDGHFPGREPEPIPQNLETLRACVRAVGADLGVAHDGDADRATFVDETGQVLWGDQSFAIVASRKLKPGSLLITPVSSGRLIEDVVNNASARIEWTKVGSVVVSHRIVQTGADLGGEENGGVFYPRHQPVRDGPMTVALIAEIMSLENRTLSGIVAELPRYYSRKSKLVVPLDRREKTLEALMELTRGEKRVTIDGVKVIREEGWFLMRPSGTEPIWRCFAEGKQEQTAESLLSEAEHLVRTASGT
ncbi:MAG: phosphoglucosamine mutase [Candidatus Thorarchaeota archaeon]